MNEMPQENQPGQKHQSAWRVFGWVALGLILGLVLVAVFLAYGQPELLLEQLNLRYCG